MRFASVVGSFAEAPPASRVAAVAAERPNTAERSRSICFGRGHIFIAAAPAALLPLGPLGAVQQILELVHDDPVLPRQLASSRVGRLPDEVDELLEALFDMRAQ